MLSTALPVFGRTRGTPKPPSQCLVYVVGLDWQWACVTSGIVTAVSVMMNGSSTESALAYAAAHKVSVGIHFNLTEGVPLCPPAALASLVVSDPLAAGGLALRGKLGFWEAVTAGEVVMEQARMACDGAVASVCVGLWGCGAVGLLGCGLVGRWALWAVGLGPVWAVGCGLRGRGVDVGCQGRLALLRSLRSSHPAHMGCLQARAELLAQLQRFRDLTGGWPAHVDGHQVWQFIGCTAACSCTYAWGWAASELNYVAPHRAPVSRTRTLPDTPPLPPAAHSVFAHHCRPDRRGRRGPLPPPPAHTHTPLRPASFPVCVV
jgi:hypothetical protein